MTLRTRTSTLIASFSVYALTSDIDSRSLQPLNAPFSSSAQLAIAVRANLPVFLLASRSSCPSLTPTRYPALD